MNLQSFLNFFHITSTCNTGPIDRKDSNSPLEELADSFGGSTFGHGLYRVLRADQIAPAKSIIDRIFPEQAGTHTPFAYDWLGRHFALALDTAEPEILLLEVGAGEVMTICATLEDFHNIELTEYANDSIALNFWESWQKENPDQLDFTKCVGYKVPLFLGGADELHNLELTDMSVYLEFCAQLREKTRHLPAGTKVSGITFG